MNGPASILAPCPFVRQPNGLQPVKCGLLPLTQTAMRFYKVGYHDYCGVVLDLSERESLVRDLGDNNALILRNHGLLTIGRTIPETFNAMHRLELSCKAQLAAMACNTELNPVPKDVLEESYMNYQPQTRRPYGVMEWPALLRKLDRIDPRIGNEREGAASRGGALSIQPSTSTATR
ncbi:hypothetical protein QFZ97_008076 [Paraburkholderia youngii]